MSEICCNFVLPKDGKLIHTETEQKNAPFIDTMRGFVWHVLSSSKIVPVNTIWLHSSCIPMIQLSVNVPLQIRLADKMVGDVWTDGANIRSPVLRDCKVKCFPRHMQMF